VSAEAVRRRNARCDWPARLSTPSRSQEAGNDASCRASSAESMTVGPIPHRAAGGPLEELPGTQLVVGVELSGRAAPTARSRAKRGAAGAAALPCQNSNNSDKKPKRYRLTAIPGTEGLFADPSNARAYWQQREGDTLERWGKPSGADAKSAFHLRQNVASFVKHWGRNHCLFFTVTDEANLHPTQFARRWNNYLRRNGQWIASFIRVLEPQKKGRPHYHLLVAVLWDTRADSFDWQAFDECQNERRANGHSGSFRQLRARYKASAAPELVALWSLLRKVLPRYGLGRAELLPLRKGREAISEYIGKYLEAGLTLRKHSWKGCRRVEFDRRAKNAWLCCSRVFAWHSPGAKAWRARVGQIATALGVGDMEGIRRKIGSKWAYQLREYITLADDADWQVLLALLSKGALLLLHNRQPLCPGVFE